MSRRVVLYTEDFEPITVLELQPWAEDYLREQGTVNLSVFPSPLFFAQPWEQDAVPPRSTYRVVTIRAETFLRHGRRHMMLFTHDEECALLLKSAFLPGQTAALNERDRESFARGFMDALQRLGL